MIFPTIVRPVQGSAVGHLDIDEHESVVFQGEKSGRNALKCNESENDESAEQNQDETNAPDPRGHDTDVPGGGSVEG
jgi:hypothetical protein